MALEIKNEIHAMCILHPGAIGAGTFVANRGFESAGAGVPVRNGNGDYTLTFSQPIAATESVAIVYGDLATCVICSFTRPAAATIRVYSVDAAGAFLADTADMHIVVFRSTP